MSQTVLRQSQECHQESCLLRELLWCQSLILSQILLVSQNNKNILGYMIFARKLSWQFNQGILTYWSPCVPVNYLIFTDS